MDPTPDHQLFADLDQILTNAQTRITEEATNTTIANIAQFFRMTPRQARIILDSTNRSLIHAAGIAGRPIADFLPTVSPNARLAMLAFTAGAVNQHDIDHSINPETGEPQP